MDQTLLTLLRRVDTPTVLNAIEAISKKFTYEAGMTLLLDELE